MIKKMAILLVIAANGCGDHRTPALRFPPVSGWPSGALVTCAAFRDSAETNRHAQASDVEIAFRRLQGKGKVSLGSSDIKRLLGQPRDERPTVLHYTTWVGGNDAGAISFWFEAGSLVKIAQGAGQLMPKGAANNGADPIR
jgi:hypothetical protein